MNKSNFMSLNQFKKTVKKQSINDFKSYKKLYKLTKQNSPNIIEFVTDDLPDEWFITVLTYRRKSGTITNSYTIIAKQLSDHLESFQKEGWILT